jgi:hypothetical protein
VRPTDTHEHFAGDAEIVEASPRAFGFVFSGFFAVTATWPLFRGGPVRTWALALAAVFLVAALIAPAALRPLSRIWQYVGLALHRVVNPIVMGLLFFFAITPFGLVMRLLGKGLARRLRPDPHAESYWVGRTGETPSSMKNQF